MTIGILQRATDAKTKTERQSVIEQARTDVLGYQADNRGGNLEKSQLKAVLDTYFEDVPTMDELPDGEDLLNREFTTLDKYGTHTIKVSEIYNGSFAVTNSGEGETLLGPNGKPLVNQETVAEITEEEIIGEDALGNQVVVPAGFKLAQGNNGSGSTVKEGIVIEDNAGNQYVWIPVSNIDGSNTNPIVTEEDELGNQTTAVISLGRHTFNEHSSEVPTAEGTYQYASTYTTPVALRVYTIDSASSKYFQELPTYRQSNGLLNTTGTNTTARGKKQADDSYNGIQGFIESVRDNKGYYIARYEASYRTNGKAGSIPSTSSGETLASTSAPSTRTAGDLWNFVTQGEAATACYDLYTTVNSDLMNSYAWDTAIVYIQAMGNEGFLFRNMNEPTLKNTGDTGDEVCKVFDMSSNEYEWTTEMSTRVYNSRAMTCVMRGAGTDHYSGEQTCFRTDAPATYAVQSTSFRPVLYL